MREFFEKYPLSTSFAGVMSLVNFIESHPTLQFIILQVFLFGLDFFKQKYVGYKVKRQIKKTQKGIEITQSENDSTI